MYSLQCPYGCITPGGRPKSFMYQRTYDMHVLSHRPNFTENEIANINQRMCSLSVTKPASTTASVVEVVDDQETTGVKKVKKTKKPKKIKAEKKTDEEELIDMLSTNLNEIEIVKKGNAKK